MSRPVCWSLLTLSLVLVLVPLAAPRPGLPPTLKADEPAYYLMALSLLRDGDLLFERADVDRIVQEYPYGPVHNLILMSDDGWSTVYFGKPYIFSLLAAPFVALAGANGMVAFNMALLAGMIWLGTLYLSRYNESWLAALFSAAFFLLSTATPYAFWLHPEILNMAAAMGGLFFVFHTPGPRIGRWARLRGPAAATVASAALLTLGIYNKPVLAAFALPILFVLRRRRGWRPVAAWLLAAALTLGALAGLSTALTGHPSAYLGVARSGLKIESPETIGQELDKIREIIAVRAVEGRRAAVNSWFWIFRPPDLDWRELAANCGYFLVGRHTGLVPYMPFAALVLGLFLLRGPRPAESWLIATALAAIALFFLIWIPINWHGGGGFVGNRYFAMCYPAFLFFVTSVRPRWLVAAGAAASALLLGTILATPYGAPVPEPTLQAHARAPLFRLFPMEWTIRDKIPGYSVLNYGRVVIMGRKDLISLQKRDGSPLWIQGAQDVEAWMLAEKPLTSLLFAVWSPADDNRVEIELPGARQELVFTPGDADEPKERVVELTPGEPSRIAWHKPVRFRPGRRLYVYDLRIRTATGHLPRRPSGTVIQPQFYLGAQLTYLGLREQLEREEHYKVEWQSVAAPARAAAGAELEVPVRVRNRGQSPWSPQGPIPVRLSYHWLDASGRALEDRSVRTDLAADLPPGGAADVAIRVQAPAEPGDYLLVLDVVRENVAWFSRRGAATAEARITVERSE